MGIERSGADRKIAWASSGSASSYDGPPIYTAALVVEPCPADQSIVSISSMNSGQSHGGPLSPERSSDPHPARAAVETTTATNHLHVGRLRAGSTTDKNLRPATGWATPGSWRTASINRCAATTSGPIAHGSRRKSSLSGVLSPVALAAPSGVTLAGSDPGGVFVSHITVRSRCARFVRAGVHEGLGLGAVATFEVSNGSSNGWFVRRPHGELPADMLRTRNPW
jgi:hypothetical protein